MEFLSNTDFIKDKCMISTLYMFNIFPKTGNIILKKSKDISILIPCYNKSKYLLDCVYSCINQTMKPCSIVILLMDEASIAMKSEIESIDPTIQCIISNRLDACTARTTLVNQYCYTDWFILLDADDMLMNNCLEVLYNEPASVCFPSVQHMTESGSIAYYDKVFDSILLGTGHPISCLSGNLTALMNKEVFNSIGLDSELCRGGEDFDFQIRLFEQQKYRISVSDKTCYYYRRSTYGLTNSDEFYESHLKSVKKNIEFLHKEYVEYNGYNQYEQNLYENPSLHTYFTPCSGENNTKSLDVCFNIDDYANDAIVFLNFDKALRQLENSVEDKLRITLSIRDTTKISDYLECKILDRLRDYRRVTLYTENIEEDSIWYSQYNYQIIHAFSDWKQYPHNISRSNLHKNEIPMILLAPEELKYANYVLNQYPNEKFIMMKYKHNIQLCEKDVKALAYLTYSHGLKYYNPCSYRCMYIDCNCLEAKPCIQYNSSTTISEALYIIQNNSICDNCIFCID